ncbi:MULTISPECIES: PH domain-containing protein [Niastella]|uniref:DUF3575 domain-containing protein n=1 Tax=Niastella soli TaxID=2821487 RepID=A0ABS3Z0A4_9BACT|nr:hypothetical protein [Niastella soli]MBO9203601.1 hypothetical protein [Niastella soli]
MQKRWLLLWVILTGSFLMTNAQEAKQEQPAKKGCSCSFSSINLVGIITGAKNNFYQLQTINGIRYKTWFAGIGVGVDPYFRTSYPLFLDLRKNIFKKSSTPFLYADVGGHFLKDKTDQLNQWYEDIYSSGVYTDAGMGYRFTVLSKIGLAISAGYSYKYVERRNKFIGDNCTTGRCYDNYYTYRQYLHRGTIKLGFQF